MGFIHNDLLLETNRARQMFHEYAKEEPILDFHTHLPARDIAENRHFENLFEIWLEGDHYKWRAMRADGVAEEYCTGEASPYEKFLAWARTVPHTLRNPLYQWTHLELKRYFDIDVLLNENSAPKVWEEANTKLTKLSTRTMLEKFRVRALCTTDDPTDDLKYHHRIASSGLATKVYPTFRPDKALNIRNSENFNGWVDCLQKATNKEIRTLAQFLESLQARHDSFHQAGCRLSDHGLSRCYASSCSEAVAAGIFDRVRTGETVSEREQDLFASFMMRFFGHLDADKGWTKQLHLGAQRNNNTRALQSLGPDTGFDSMGDWQQVEALGRYLDRLELDGALPKTIVYNLNPADNYAFATMIGNFQDGSTAGKLQLGSGWWFLDQKQGIEWQMDALSNTGLLSRFVGMVTDSRSFMSYPRHEYFRRVLCNVLGNDMEKGLVPDDPELVGQLVRAICYSNAKTYLELPEA
jgi:glucuronate isomerase